MGNNMLIVNMTNFFNRELFMYSLGDIKFKKPIALKKVAYVTAFLILWGGTLFALFGLMLHPMYVALLIGPPIVLGHFATKPVWGGRGLIDFIKVSAKFIGEPRGWTDLNPNNTGGSENLHTEQEIWVSRRREMKILAHIKDVREGDPHE